MTKEIEIFPTGSGYRVEVTLAGWLVLRGAWHRNGWGCIGEAPTDPSDDRDQCGVMTFREDSEELARARVFKTLGVEDPEEVTQ